MTQTLDKHYELKIEKRNIGKISYISTKHIDPLGNEVWGRICREDINPEKFIELERVMEATQWHRH